MLRVILFLTVMGKDEDSAFIRAPLGDSALKDGKENIGQLPQIQGESHTGLGPNPVSLVSCL